MSRAFVGDLVRVFAEEQGITLEAARSRKRRGHESWERFVAAHAPQKVGGRVRGCTVLERYRALEEDAHRQLVEVQAQLDGVIAAGDVVNLKTYVQAVDILTGLYSDAQQKRRAAEVMEGCLLPASVIDEYKLRFYPRIAASLQELGMAVESLLPQHMRADFAAVWEQCLPGHFAVLAEAEAGLEAVRPAAAEEGRRLLKKQKSLL